MERSVLEWNGQVAPAMLATSGGTTTTSRESDDMAIIDEQFMADLQAIQHRLWAKVEKTDGCWNWKAMKDPNGYGRFYVKCKPIQAHRAVYLLAVGMFPTETILDHKCRNKGCVNPDHLRPVTNKQNGENVGMWSNNTTGYRGVFLEKDKYRSKPWRARIGHNMGILHVGFFATAEEANEAVIAKRLELQTHNEVDKAVRK